jgi:hypothetical protein
MKTRSKKTIQSYVHGKGKEVESSSYPGYFAGDEYLMNREPDPRCDSATGRSMPTISGKANYLPEYSKNAIRVQKKSLPPIQNSSQKVKLGIDDLANRKIRRLCQLFPKKEWSGVLFYKVEGSLNNSDLRLQVIDLHPLNLGTSGSTSFKPGPEIVKYVINNDLVDCCQGLIHSHNVMEVFFSSTDVSTLHEQVLLTNRFLSLIVNDFGERCARLAVLGKVQVEETCKASFVDFDGSERLKSTKRDYLTNRCIVHECEIEEDVVSLDSFGEDFDNAISAMRDSRLSPALGGGYPGSFYDDEEEIDMLKGRGYDYHGQV